MLKAIKNCILFIFLWCSTTVLAQGEANNWFFGQSAGLNFNTNPPTPMIGSIQTEEGCASFSDKEGNLLFYTDGSLVYNKNHQVMPNGNNLRGNPSSTQSGIIVPHPGNPSQFYIFTVGANFDGKTSGLNAYVVDMQEDNGLGDIIVGPIDLSKGDSQSWTEKVTSVKGADCKSFWVISLVRNIYHVYKIDENGLNETPIKSPVSYYSIDDRGYLKVSPDGRKIASATFNYWTDENGVGHLGAGRLHLYDFDDSKGTVGGNEITLINSSAIDGEPYGVEFSPNSTKLYCSTFNGTLNSLLQYDIEADNIQASKVLIKSQPGYRGGMQLAPNGKIYASVPPSYYVGTQFLDAINNPDAKGIECDYEPDALFLGSGRAMQGLPPFISSLLLPIEITSVAHENETVTNQTISLCVGSEYTFVSENLPGTPDYSWTHNGIEISTDPQLELTDLDFSNSGSYKLEVNLIDDCGFDITYEGNFEVLVYDPPVVNRTFSYEQCDIDSNSTDGITLFNLNTKIAEITGGDTELEVAFFENQSDLDMDVVIDNPETYMSSSKLLYFKLIHKESRCFTSGELQLNAYPTSLDTYKNLFSCEDLSSASTSLASIGNGTGTFDLELKRQEILNIFSDPNIQVNFYLESSDAQLQVNELEGILNLEPAIIYTRISNLITNDCISVGTFELIVNAIPQVLGNESEQILCVNNPRDNTHANYITLDGTSGGPLDIYQWYLNGNAIPGATQAQYDAKEGGTYTVFATRIYQNDPTLSSDDTSCTGFNSFKIVESNPPGLSQQYISVIDDSTNNSIEIDITNLGLGDYEFALLTSTNYFDFQAEPLFENIEPGIHILYARDRNGCGTTEIEVSVLGFLKFFSPNNDGINDTWKVLGVNENFYTSSTIYIYDRFGKLIKQVDLKSDGWDGTLNGEILPSTDYWFFAELIDKKGNTRVKTGHFSMIR